MISLILIISFHENFKGGGARPQISQDLINFKSFLSDFHEFSLEFQRGGARPQISED